MDHRRTLSTLLAAVALSTLPATAAAQMCAGVPNTGRDLTISGIAAFTEGIDSYGVGVDFNSPGYFSYGVAYLTDRIEGEDDDGRTFRGQIAAELDPDGDRGWPVSVCIVGTAEYNRFDTEFSLGEFSDQRLSFGGGVGIGKEFPLTSTVSLGGWVIPGFRYTSAEREITAGGFVQTEEDDGSGLTAHLGGALRFQRFFVSGEYTYVDLEGADDVFEVSLGYNIGLQ